MNQLNTQQEVRAWVREQRNSMSGVKIALVPTMGNLHEGHVSLMRLAQDRGAKVIASVFVNPMQFGPEEDFDRYPRTFESDCAKLEAAGVDAVFAPSVHEMYPRGLTQTRVCADPALAGLLEGQARPGHFDGVTTIVMKLFQMVQPDMAVFGQKDYQQWRVLAQMVADLAMPIELVCGPIARDVDGLALSSRNQYLNPSQRAAAPILNRVLEQMKAAITSGEKNIQELEQAAEQQLISAGFDAVDYVRVCDAHSLLPVTEMPSNSFASKDKVILAVARMGTTRLLDNRLIQ